MVPFLTAPLPPTTSIFLFPKPPQVRCAYYFRVVCAGGYTISPPHSQISCTSLCVGLLEDLHSTHPNPSCPPPHEQGLLGGAQWSCLPISHLTAGPFRYSSVSFDSSGRFLRFSCLSTPHFLHTFLQGRVKAKESRMTASPPTRRMEASTGTP